MRRKRIKREEIKTGMILADDVYNLSDQLILPKRTILNDKHIAKLSIYHIPAVTIMERTESAESGVTGEEEEIDLSKLKIKKETEEKKQFHKMLDTTMKQVKNSLDNLAKNVTDKSGIESMVLSAGTLLNQTKGAGDVFDMLVQMKDASDQVYQHSLNVAFLSVTLGKWMRFSEADLDVLLMAGLLHDVGKLLIPQNILLKPYKLNDKEFNIIKSHTVRGYNLLKKSDIDARVKHVALMHHERCDGSGYPMGVKGDKLPPFAKIVAIADVYDAMTSNRTYRDSVCPFDVIANFEADGLQKFDIEYIMTFLKNLANMHIHNKVRLSDGRLGEIIMINTNKISRPVVQLRDLYVDLSKESTALKIGEILDK